MFISRGFKNGPLACSSRVSTRPSQNWVRNTSPPLRRSRTRGYTWHTRTWDRSDCQSDAELPPVKRPRHLGPHSPPQDYGTTHTTVLLGLERSVSKKYLLADSCRRRLIKRDRFHPYRQGEGRGRQQQDEKQCEGRQQSSLHDETSPLFWTTIRVLFGLSKGRLQSEAALPSSALIGPHRPARPDYGVVTEAVFDQVDVPARPKADTL